MTFAYKEVNFTEQIVMWTTVKFNFWQKVRKFPTGLDN